MEHKPVSDFRLKLDLHIVKYQKPANLLLNIISILVSVITLGALIYYYGFPVSSEMKIIIQKIINGSLIFYIVKYLISLFYSLKHVDYIKDTIIEFVIIQLLILHFISILILPSGFDFFRSERFQDLYFLFIQLYFLGMVIIEISKVSIHLGSLKISPPALMLLSFLILILAGTGLLLLPEMTCHGISFIDALFTSTSAGCVTGLSVLSTGSDFTFKGQIVIMILVQLGGMSILTFATFFSAFFSGNKTGLRYQHLVRDILSADKLTDSFQLLKSIVSTTLVIEIVGCILLFACWQGNPSFASDGETLFYSVFHTITAFNNAGFSLWDDNLMDLTIHNSYIPQTIIMLLVLVGGIGFMALTDLFNPKFIRERKEKRWKKLLSGTKIVLYTTSGIILFGTLIFFLTEYNHSLADSHSVFDKFFRSAFQVIASRTAGFNTIDIKSIAIPGLLILMLLMFIGASPGSTGGGIKTTTFFVLIKSVIATIKGKKRIEFNKRTIPFEIVDKSYSIIIMSMMLIFLSCFLLSIFEPGVSFQDIIFESISAFSTSGLSTGCVTGFDWQGKMILIVNMYVGRIGTLTMAFALSKRIKESQHHYPDTYFMVG